MAGGILGTAITGLVAFQRSLETTSHNIANVNTEGYSRQKVELATFPEAFIGGSFLGQGVIVTNISRNYDQFLSTQLRSSTSAFKNVEQYQRLASQVDNIMADPSTGMGPAMNAFFKSVQGVASDPSSIPARQTLLSQAEVLTQRFNTMNGRFDELRSQVNNDLQGDINNINEYATAIAELNGRIANDLGRSSGLQQPNDLLDQRDEMVRKLSELVDVTVIPQATGMYSVFIGKGQPVVLDRSSSQFSLQTADGDPEKLDITIKTSTTEKQVITGQLNGGKIKGSLDFRDQVLDPAQQKLGGIAVGLAMEINAIHAKGIDLDGHGDPLDANGDGILGTNFFKFTGSAEVPVTPLSKNQGGLQVSATFNDTNINPLGASASDIDSSDYVLSFDGANYALTRVHDNQVIALTAQTINSPPDPVQVPASNVRLVPVNPLVKLPGIDLKIDSATTAAAGDQFLIRPTYNAADRLTLNLTDPRQIAAATNIETDPVTGKPVPLLDATTGSPVIDAAGNPVYKVLPGVVQGDNRNILLLAGLENRTTMLKDTATFQDAYGQIVSSVGTFTHAANLSASAQEALLNNAKSANDSVSGVNLDEEAANLIKFQQAYQAAAQLISTTNTLFDKLLSSVQ